MALQTATSASRDLCQVEAPTRVLLAYPDTTNPSLSRAPVPPARPVSTSARVGLPYVTLALRAHTKTGQAKRAAPNAPLVLNPTPRAPAAIHVPLARVVTQVACVPLAPQENTTVVELTIATIALWGNSPVLTLNRAQTVPPVPMQAPQAPSPVPPVPQVRSHKVVPTSVSLVAWASTRPQEISRLAPSASRVNSPTSLPVLYAQTALQAALPEPALVAVPTVLPVRLPPSPTPASTASSVSTPPTEPNRAKLAWLANSLLPLPPPPAQPAAQAPLLLPPPLPVPIVESAAIRL